MSQSEPISRSGNDKLPWYVRGAIVTVLLIILLILAIDVLVLIGAL